MDMQMNERTQVARVLGSGPGSLRPAAFDHICAPAPPLDASKLGFRALRAELLSSGPPHAALSRVLRMKRLGLLGVLVFSVSACSSGGFSSFGPASAPPASLDAPSLLVVRSVASGTSSVKVGFDAVPNAADYRIYDASDPTHMKYAGLVLPPSRRTPLVPNQQIEWNGLVAGRRATLVVEAVDRLGPFPATGVAAFSPPLAAGCGLAASAVRAPATLGPLESETFVPGGDTGPASSGAVVSNGRGCPSNVPAVIARSAPFTVLATALPALPSNSAASQVFFDGFAPEEAQTLNRIVAGDPIAGTETFTLGRPPVSWTLLVDNADVATTSAFIGGGQLNDVLFDQPAARVNPAARAARASLALVPNATADFSNGRILHATFEVDSHLSSRRTISFDLAPATDPLSSPLSSATPNRSASALFFEIQGGPGSPLLLDELAGLHGGAPVVQHVLGAPGSALHESLRSGPDLGLDDRERWDFFVSQSHFAIFENGVRVSEYDLPAALPFSQAKLYFAHSLDHSAAELASLKSGAPWESFWIDNAPFSDERHWNDVGFEVLPAATPWSSAGSLLRIPPPEPPSFSH